MVVIHDEPLPNELETVRKVSFFRLTRRWTLAVRDGDLHHTVNIARGFLTDGSSVPLLLQVFIVLGGGSRLAMTRPGVLHDWLYSTQRYPRRQADRWWREYCRQEGIGLITSWGCWLLLRAAGWWQWRKCARALRRGEKGETDD